MRQKMISKVCAVIAVTIFVTGAAVVAGKTVKKGNLLSVRALRAPLMRAPRFFGPSVMKLKRGEKVSLIRAQGAWYFVEVGGKRGWIHKNRVSAEAVKLQSGATGGGATRGEAELAGRGFNPTVEQKFRGNNAALDFSHIDKIEKAEVDLESVSHFMATGGILLKSGDEK